jgi:ornithine carbamoyltransferase
VKHFLSVLDFSKSEWMTLLNLSDTIKKYPKKYHKSLYEKTLMTFFQAPSLRTEVSFDVGMFKMGGEIIDYHSETSPWAKGKERIEDVAKVVSRYCDIIMIRMYDHTELLKFARFSTIPVINGLTMVEHPCQTIADFMTMREEFGSLKGLKVAYVGDAHNNVTHSLMLGAGLFGMDFRIGCPLKKNFVPLPSMVRKTKQLMKHSGGLYMMTSNAGKAVADVDVVYTDSWMSYHINPSEKKRRLNMLKPYRVTQSLMNRAQEDAIFMHCLPALRGMEVTSGVIDGKQSVVFDQAENRMHTEKALLLWLLK